MAASPEYDALARFLATLGNPNRLALLRQLRRPRRVAELKLAPESSRRGENPERHISRQAVRHHLEKLLAVDVTQLHRRGSAFTGDEYLVNHRQLFVIAEQLRDLARLKPTDAPFQSETRAALPTTRPTAPGRRAVVLVHGIDEGRSWPIEGPGAWLVGRAKTAIVRLDYDPFVSSRHGEIRSDGLTARVMDLGSRNGTLLNFAPIPANEERPIVPGDVLTFGRSSLVLRGTPNQS